MDGDIIIKYGDRRNRYSMKFCNQKDIQEGIVSKFEIEKINTEMETQGELAKQLGNEIDKIPELIQEELTELATHWELIDIGLGIVEKSKLFQYKNNVDVL
ncbi:hypothetical protein LOAG_10671 [Loa loa]|uniref:Uncharacterized protein n=1 Tax=Loa loa TaxID=7209 RepID=A0A1S0TPB6_LOALO|nr:hypothetical protein LOAG_10671 [Loa loa]EFO17825.1 hypothetical protein LOAG_10671 [Loa loa]